MRRCRCFVKSRTVQTAFKTSWMASTNFWTKLLYFLRVSGTQRHDLNLRYQPVLRSIDHSCYYIDVGIRARSSRTLCFRIIFNAAFCAFNHPMSIRIAWKNFATKHLTFCSVFRCYSFALCRRIPARQISALIYEYRTTHF